MNTLDKFLNGASNFFRDTVGVDTERNSQLLNSVGQGFGKALTAVNWQPLKQKFQILTNPQTLNRAGQDFKEQAIKAIKPQVLAVLTGALLGGAGATAYNINKHLRSKKNKRGKEPVQMRYASDLSRVYGGASLGALLALLFNKYSNKINS